MEPEVTQLGTSKSGIRTPCLRFQCKDICATFQLGGLDKLVVEMMASL